MKEVDLWRIGRKVHSFFQAGLKRMDQLIESVGQEAALDNTVLDTTTTTGTSVQGTSQATDSAPYLKNPHDIFNGSEYSEAELVLALKFWIDELPAPLAAQLDPRVMDGLDSRVNGRAVGLQLLYSMFRVMLLYPNVLAIGTGLLAMSVPASSQVQAQAQAQTQQIRQQIQQQQHSHRRHGLLEKITQCVQEANRIVLLAGIILDRYPERAKTSCLGVALDWCLRIYHKVVIEKRVARAGEPDTTTTTASTSTGEDNVRHGVAFSPRFKHRCRMQVTKVEALLKRYQGLDHQKYFYSWLTTELDPLEERRRAAQQRMIQQCCEGLAVDGLTAGMQTTQSIDASSGTVSSDASMAVTGGVSMTPQQQQDLLDGRPKMHDLQAIIRKRQQMGIYDQSGIRPNGGNLPWAQPSLSTGNMSTTVSSAPALPPNLPSSAVATTMVVPSHALPPSTPSSVTINLGSEAGHGTGTGIMFSDANVRTSMATMVGMPVAVSMAATGIGGGMMSLSSGGLIHCSGSGPNLSVVTQQPVYHFGYYPHAQSRAPVSTGGFLNTPMNQSSQQFGSHAPVLSAAPLSPSGHFPTSPSIAQVAPAAVAVVGGLSSPPVFLSGSGPLPTSSGMVLANSIGPPNAGILHQQHQQQQQHQHQQHQQQHPQPRLH